MIIKPSTHWISCHLQFIMRACALIRAPIFKRSISMSFYYELENPTELKAIEISDKLNWVKFYYNVNSDEESDNYDINEEQSRIRGTVRSAVHMPFPGAGITSHSFDHTEISPLQEYSEMSKFRRDHIAETINISEQLHPLEWMLIKARNSNILPEELYKKIRIDVRNRVLQFQDVRAKNKVTYEDIIKNIRLVDPLNIEFKPIRAPADVDEFRGKIVAYLSDSDYFTRYNETFTCPVEGSEKKVRFAKIHDTPEQWDICDSSYSGYRMDLFLNPNGIGDAHALISPQISKDKGFKMRLVTVQEWQLLNMSLAFGQAKLNYGDLDRAVTQAAPPAMKVKNGVVDWSQESEHKESITPPKPSNVYLINGGNILEKPGDRASRIVKDAFAMHAIYYNKDRSECAVVLSCDDDTFNLMNFDKAKELAGQEKLPSNFVDTFGDTATHGVITIPDEKQYKSESRSSFFSPVSQPPTKVPKKTDESDLADPYESKAPITRVC